MDWKKKLKNKTKFKKTRKPSKIKQLDHILQKQIQPSWATQSAQNIQPSYLQGRTSHFRWTLPTPLAFLKEAPPGNGKVVLFNGPTEIFETKKTQSEHPGPGLWWKKYRNTQIHPAKRSSFATKDYHHQMYIWPLPSGLGFGMSTNLSIPGRFIHEKRWGFGVY